MNTTTTTELRNLHDIRNNVLNRSLFVIEKLKTGELELTARDVAGSIFLTEGMQLGIGLKLKGLDKEIFVTKTGRKEYGLMIVIPEMETIRFFSLPILGDSIQIIYALDATLISLLFEKEALKRFMC